MMPIRYYVPALGDTEADAREIEVPSGLPDYAAAEECAQAEWERHIQLELTPDWPLEFVLRHGRARVTRWTVDALVGVHFAAEPLPDLEGAET